MHWRSARAARALVPALCAWLLASCADDAGDAGVGPRIASLLVYTGSGQTGPIGGTLAQPLVVLVEDQRGNPVEGAVIEFTVTSGNGLVTPRADTTDGDGLAQTTFRLGSSIGVQTVSAALAGVSPVSFTANATSAPASKLLATAGDAQTAQVGARLPLDLQVRVTDAFDNPKSGVPVSFTVVSGGGTVSGNNVVSDANGLARVSWTLGTVAGQQSVIAGSGTVSPIAFAATATPDNPASFVIVSGGGQTAVPGAALPDSVVVRLVDQYGNGIAGQTVTWNAGTGAVSPGTTITSTTGRTAVRWTLASIGGPQLLSATAGSVAGQVSGAALVSYLSISTGGRHTCGLGVGGAVYCWGFNGDAELGIGTTPAGSGPVFAEPMPVATTGNWTFRDLSTGMGHSCAVVLTGEAFCWGSNVDGRIGQETHTTERFTTPQQVKTTYTFTTVTSGRAHNCGIGFSTRPVCWGSNHEGEVGVVGGPVILTDSSTIDFPQYVNNPVFGLGSVSISAGGVHACSVASTGAVHCWGNNTFGQLGNGTFTRAPSPVPVSLGVAATSVAAGGYHTCALGMNGAAHCWGRNTEGQLGTGNTTSSTVPVSVSGALTFSMLTAGTSHTCGLTGAGAVYCWGRNTHGQLGDGSTTSRTTPTLVGGGLTFVNISAGEAQTCGVTTGNLAYCWGDNEFGALGDGTLANRVLPTKVRFQP